MLALVFVQTGCKKFVEGYDVSPNDPIDVNLEVLLTGTQVATFSNFTGNLTRTPAVLVNQMTGRQFQFEDVQEYVIEETSIDNDFQQLYTGGMLNAQIIIDKAGDANKYYRGIGRILRVMNIGLATDCWGDVPNTAALKGAQGEANLSPAYDSQENILRDMQASLDLAIQDLSSDASSNIKIPGADDLIFGGDVAAWRNTAYALKARYHNRLSKRDPAASATDALSALDDAYSNGYSTAEDMMVPTGQAANEWNQWYAFEQQRAGYITMNQFFLDMLAGDPRLLLYAASDDDMSPIGPLYGNIGAPLPLVTFFEAKFIEAEAALRANNKVRAAAAHNDAVKANLAKLGINDPAFVAAKASETDMTITLEKIMTQKYIAMFTQPEVWTDWRRTDFPKLTPNANASVPAIPRRLTTAQSERLYNANAMVVTNVLEPVWWDQ